MGDFGRTRVQAQELDLPVANGAFFSSHAGRATTEERFGQWCYC